MKCATTTIHGIFQKLNPTILSKDSVFTKPIGKHDNYKKIKIYLNSIGEDINNYYIFFLLENQLIDY